MGFKAKVALIVINVFIAIFGAGMGVEFTLEYVKFKLTMCLFGMVFGYAILAVAIFVIIAACCECRLLLLVYIGILSVLMITQLAIAGYMIGYYKSEAHKGEMEAVVTEMKKGEEGSFGSFWIKMKDFSGENCCGCRNVTFAEVACPTPSTRRPTNVTMTSGGNTTMAVVTSTVETTVKPKDCCEAFESVWSDLMTLLAGVLIGGAVVEIIAIMLAFYVFKDAALLIPGVV